MTDYDKSTIQRMLGKIEGVAMVLDNTHSAPLFDALEVIDSIFDKEGECENDR